MLDTSIEGVYSSIGWLAREQWYLGGILRSLHRYASDAFVVVMFLHLLREWAYGRYHGFRFYSWITGVPLIWLVYVSGIGGYWIVWDRLAQFSAVATAELLDWLPFFNEPIARNFLAPDSINDRFFTVLVFIHIGVPLMLILGLWAHVNRISRVDYLPSRRVMLATLASFLALALLKPALSAAPADLAQVPAEVPLDWFILFLHPLTDFTSPAAVWALIFGATLLLFALPFLPHPAAAPIAVVDAPNCNGCSRCHVDCPYEAITMAPHPDKPNHKIAIVDADHCAGCGICAGSCPSSTPFRSQQRLVTGIDMPQQPVDALRQQLEAQLARLRGEHKTGGLRLRPGRRRPRPRRRRYRRAEPDLHRHAAALLHRIRTAQRRRRHRRHRLPRRRLRFPPRHGMDARTAGAQREPHLRALVPQERIEILPAARGEQRRLAAAVAAFRTRLESQGEAAQASRLLPEKHHG